MDGFELVVGRGHADEGVGAVVGGEEVFEVVELCDEGGSAAGRCVDDVAGGGVADVDLLGVGAEADGLAAEGFANLADEFHGDGADGELLRADTQGGAVAEDFFDLGAGGGVGWLAGAGAGVSVGGRR